MSVRKAVPEPLQRLGRRGYVALGGATAGARVLPDFIMIGGQRCGTTSLFRALMEHPQVVRPTFHKGINYFDVNYDRGFDWYRGHFPLRASARLRTRQHGHPVVFEASGYYMFHPFAMERLAREMPDVKLVAMLRDPVERAYSAWKHESARGFEREDFDTALALEDERLLGEYDRMRRDPTYESFTHRHHAYRRRGDYADQLERILQLFPREQLHIMYSERFFEQPGQEFAALGAFLGLGSVSPQRFDRYNARPAVQDMSASARARLADHFRQANERLAELLHETPPWSLTREPAA
ncbi:sulfotransferase domain-containing protein [Segeticoccus rhizosphaerae]|uniref:sulfotransferase domain-containing protein n=1 Tax=Segeticoccus rhizosphaerae TaxID=1104777 RepID=UPI0010C12490|nr:MULTISPECIES: sulfotransferase domain-containing protein [Intrasporangiaceae]